MRSPSHHWLFALSLLLLCGAVRAEEIAELAPAVRKQRARDHYDLGRTQYRLDQFDAAVEEFEKGYRYQPLPLFLFNIAQASRKAGHNDKALSFYRKFLVVAPRAPEAGEARQRIGELEQLPPAPMVTTPAPRLETMPPRTEPPAPAPMVVVSPPAAPPSSMSMAATTSPPVRSSRTGLAAGLGVTAVLVVGAGVTTALVLALPAGSSTAPTTDLGNFNAFPR